MTIKVSKLMTKSVITAQPHQSVEHVRNMLEKNRISSVPVVDTNNHPVGIVSSADLAHDLNSCSPISTLMTQKVYTIPQYNDSIAAARLMRNHNIHHVVVTHEKTIVGMLSAFDLLKLVEEHRYIRKNKSVKFKRNKSKRKKK